MQNYILECSLSRSWANMHDVDQSIPTSPSSIRFDFSKTDSDSESDSSYFMLGNDANSLPNEKLYFKLENA